MAFNREGRELFPAHVPGEVDEVINLVSESPDAPDAGTGLLRAQSGLFQDGAFLPSGRTRCFTPTLTPTIALTTLTLTLTLTRASLRNLSDSESPGPPTPLKKMKKAKSSNQGE